MPLGTSQFEKRGIAINVPRARSQGSDARADSVRFVWGTPQKSGVQKGWPKGTPQFQCPDVYRAS